MFSKHAIWRAGASGKSGRSASSRDPNPRRKSNTGKSGLRGCLHVGFLRLDNILFVHLRLKL
jgi:hypothetical protein